MTDHVVELAGAALAAVTFVLMAVSAAYGQDSDAGIVADIAWFGFLACALALIVLTVSVLVRGLLRTRGSGSGSGSRP